MGVCETENDDQYNQKCRFWLPAEQKQAFFQEKIKVLGRNVASLKDSLYLRLKGKLCTHYTSFVQRVWKAT